MNLLLLNQYYPPDIAPTGRYLHDLARELVRRGHRVTALCSQRSYGGGGRYPAAEDLDGVRVRRIAALGFGRRTHVGKLLDYSSFYLRCWIAIWRMKPVPDLILALTTPPYIGLLGALAAKRRRTRCAHWIMDLYPDVMTAHAMIRSGSWAHRRLISLTRRELRGSSLTLALGSEMAERIRPYLPGPEDAATLKWLPLWYDERVAPWPVGEENPVRRSLGWGTEVVLMYSGNMGLGHRFGEFLGMALRAAGEKQLRWVFAGDGKRRSDVEAFAAAHPDARIQLLAYAPAERLAEHLSAADVHLTSMEPAWRGCIMPSKIQNIFAAGRPVIFVGDTANSLARWVLESDGGWVIAPDDMEGLAAAVNQAKDPAERQRRGLAARTFAERNFDRAANCRRLCEWLEAASEVPLR